MANDEASGTSGIKSEAQPGSELQPPEEIYYGGFSRFEIELEFVQALGNPFYLVHLAEQKLFDKEEFVKYLEYLQYWKQPEYVRFLQYPGPTLHSLELLQQEQFRKDILNPEVIRLYVEDGIKAASSG